MFPQIAKRKKREVLVGDRVYRQWEETSRQLDHRAKLALKKIPNSVLHDFSKVCRIKSIPEFYANYFLVHSFKRPEPQLNNNFSEQIQCILTQSSHFHKISQCLKAREDILNALRDALLVVEGFMLMNQGKTVPLVTKATIEESVKGCQTLEELKDLQRKKTEELGAHIIKLRINAVQIINAVDTWRRHLEALAKPQTSLINKVKIIYPHQAVNCLVLLLYDSSFLRSSVLKSQMTFTKDEDDPFLQRIGKNKRGGQIQAYLTEFLKNNDSNEYKQYSERLKQELPSDEAEKLREKEIEKEQQQERLRAQKFKEQRQREEKIKTIKQEKEKKEKDDKNQREEKIKAMRQAKLRKKADHRYSSLRNLKNKGEEDNQKALRHQTSRGTRSDKRIINIDALLERNHKKGEEHPRQGDLKIVGAYQKRQKPARQSLVQSSVLSQKEEIKQQKMIWQRQIKEEQQQKQKMKKLLKQAEKKALVQTRQFEQKLKRYEEEVNNLRSRIDSAKKGKRTISSRQKPKRISLKSKESVVSIYGSEAREIPKGSAVELLESKLEEESRLKRNLESQLKELGKEKTKLQRQLQKESSRLSKESSVFQRKLEKYEQVINKLKGQSEQNRKAIRQLEHSKITQEKKQSQNLRMYTIKEKEAELKQRILQKIDTRQRKKQLKQSRLQESKVKERSNLDRSHSKSLNDSPEKNLEIVKTKQTIEIFFQSGRKGKRQSPRKKLSERQIPQKQKQTPNRQLLEAEHKLVRLEKERQLLEKKLQMSTVGKDEKRKVFESKLAEKEQKVDRVKEQLQKERERNYKLEQNIRQMRKSINNQFETRLNRERIRFQREKEELLRTIEREKQERTSRDRVLEQQMKFLKEMEKKQNELISLLEQEKREKKLKEQMLLQEIENKEQLRNQIQIEEIKRAIEREVRKELLESDPEDEQEAQLRQQRSKMEQQIQQLKQERDNEITELDKQNQRLKELIARIKGEENQLLQAIKENIDLESEEEQQNSLKGMTESALLEKTAEKRAQTANNDELIEQLKRKTLVQYRSEERKRQHYSDIENSDTYRQKQKIENIVEFYLQSPHRYPEQNKQPLPSDEKEHIRQELEAKAKLIKQFQDELFSLKDLPEYVPSIKNDAINNHLLNLRDAYQDYEADALRRQLFPPLEEEVYNEGQLSVESSEQPVITLLDEVRAHEKKHSPAHRDKEDKKNFLAINRMRLMLLQQNRKKKQRQFIEEESRKKIQRELFQKNRKKREDKLQRKREREEEQRAKKKEQLQQSILNKKKRSAQKILDIERASRSKSRSQSKSDVSDVSKASKSPNGRRQPRKSVKARSERGLSESESERDKQIHSDNERGESLGKGQQLESERQKKSEVQAIKEEQVEQSMDQKEEEEAQKMEVALLKSEIKSLQSEVRSYISGEEQFSVYQQYLNEDELDNYLQQLLELSSLELKNLNGNTSLRVDVQTYCTVTVLVAKNRKGMELGVGIFHKEYEHGEYVCDYILAHKMNDFLNLIFNFSRFIYNADRSANKIEFIFDLKYVEDQETLLHFLEFEKKCRRLGEVYVKTKNSKERKYVLKRALFEEVEEAAVVEAKGIQMRLRMLLFDVLMKEINEGFTNSDKLNHTSLNLLLAYYLSQNPEELNNFRLKAENELSYRQLLVTALLFHKKELSIKNIEQKYLTRKNSQMQVVKIASTMDVAEVKDIEEVHMTITDKLPATIKRAILEVGSEQINYLIYKPEEAVTRVQSSNSSETGLFLSLIPKYKVLIIEAEEFLTMSQANPDLTAFFYIKHFIKNIVDVKKETFERVYIPEIAEQGTNLFEDTGRRLGGSIILEQGMRIGWKESIGNSVIFTPRHRDLVIQKPFIVAVLSGAIQRAVEGSPLLLRVVE